MAGSDIVTEAQLDAAIAAIAARLGAGVAGGAGSVSERIGVISNFASPNAGGIVPGRFYDNAFHSNSGSTLVGAAGRIDLAPFYTSTPLTINQIGVACSTAAAGAQGKIVVYRSDADGWPDALEHETAALDFSSTGYKFEAVGLAFDSGTQYWLGVRHSATATLRTINVASAVNLGLGTSSTSTTYATVLRRTLAFATAAPDPWGFNAAELTNGITPPSIRMRAA